MTEIERIVKMFEWTPWAWDEGLWERSNCTPAQLAELDRITRLYARQKIELDSYLRRLRVLKSQRQSECDATAAELLAAVNLDILEKER